MAAVNWDEPSTGLVSDGNPSLTLANDHGGALDASSAGVAVAATSQDDIAVDARTIGTITGRFRSESSSALFGLAPKGVGALGMTASQHPAIGGACLADPNQPNAPSGFGVFGVSDRHQSTGAAGIALGPRSVGVIGQAESGVGVRALGTLGGVEAKTSGGHGVAGFTNGNAAAGVYGYGPGIGGAGVRGMGLAGPGVDAHSSAGPGVRAVSDQAEGVVGEAQAAHAAGVRGLNDNANGIGVDGFSQNGRAVNAISQKGTAVQAWSLQGRALDASNVSAAEPAVYAYSGGKSAVVANSWLEPGVKAFGKAGVSGSTLAEPDADDPANGAGVFGAAIGGIGVRGQTLAGIGVCGIGHPKLAWAGVFKGNVCITGVLLKSASQFSIDHPLDPRRKVLNHASVESPEYKTFYDGIAKLNAQGQARVRLPRWFEALNGDLRYQLTPLGGPAPDLHVGQEVRRGTFVIAGGRPGQRVCWQVTGVRKDTWAKQNPLAVEQSRSQARPEIPSSEEADLRKQASALRTEGAAIKRAGDKRDREARRLKPPKPSPAFEAADPPAVDTDLKAMARRILELAGEP